ncbi:MAG: flagellar basal body P-ring formation chaperone FlgA [Rhizobiaceae bacterium]
MQPRRLRAVLVALLALAATQAPAFAQEIAIVTQRVIYPGETIAPEVLREVKLKEGRQVPPAMVRSASLISGKVAKKTLLPGRYIPMDSVREAYLVDLGAPVEVVLEQGALTITLQGISLQPGSEGDMIKVRNVDSGAVFVGMIMADGTVRLASS